MEFGAHSELAAALLALHLEALPAQRILLSMRPARPRTARCNAGQLSGLHAGCRPAKAAASALRKLLVGMHAAVGLFKASRSSSRAVQHAKEDPHPQPCTGPFL